MKNYSDLSLNITLNRIGYNEGDINDLFCDPFYTLYSTRIGYQWQSSAIGWSQLTIKLIIAGTLGGITAGFLNQIGSDIYEWVKTSLSKVLNRKNNDFDNSIIELTFEDKNVIIYVDSKDDIIESLIKIEKIINYLKKSNLDEEKVIQIHNIRNINV